MKPTFENLPEEKQALILKAFFEEFVQNDYETASLSAVVSKLGIAKGSVYQYFGSKMELYRSLNTLASQKKMRYVFGIERKDFADFWEYYRALISAGIKFDLECPNESQFLYRSGQDSSNPELAEMQAVYYRQAISYFSQVIAQEQAAGLISNEFSAEFIALSITSQTMGLQNYLERFLQIRLQKHIDEDNTVFAKEAKHIYSYVDQSIAMFKKAFQPAKQ